MYRQYRSLILRTRDSSEADKFITFYTLEGGKMNAVVPGAKKIKAKLSVATEPVVESDIMVYVSSPYARPKVTGAKLIDSFTPLRTDWRRFTIAQSCAEISELLTPYGMENTAKYELLSKTWQYLTKARNPWRIFTAFALRFLKLSGYSFIEHLKNEYSRTNPAERELIYKFATLPGNEIDAMEDIEYSLESVIRKHIEDYLGRYLPKQLSTLNFCEKADIFGECVEETVKAG